MTKTPFFRPPDGDAIIVEGFVDQSYSLQFLLDTGASNTCIDFNALAVYDFDFSDPIEQVELETANGIIKADVFLIDSLDSLGISKIDFPVQIIDFIERGITSEYDGIIGLDFLAGMHFCIDTVQQQITIN